MCGSVSIILYADRNVSLPPSENGNKWSPTPMHGVRNGDFINQNKAEIIQFRKCSFQLFQACVCVLCFITLLGFGALECESVQNSA